MSSIVLNIDCLEYMKTVPDKYFSLAITDPPYGLPERSGQGAGKLANRIIQQMHKKGWDIAPKAEYFEELRRVSVNQIIWGGNYFSLGITRGFIIWDKEQPWDNFSACEFAWTSFDMPAKIYKERVAGAGEIKIHPTQKSVKLYEWILRNYAKAGDNIFDSHVGSASSRIACYKAGLDFVGCELDKEYFDLAEERFQRFIAQGDMFTGAVNYEQTDLTNKT